MKGRGFVEMGRRRWMALLWGLVVASGLLTWWWGRGTIPVLQLAGDVETVVGALEEARGTLTRAVVADYVLLLSYAVVLVVASRWAATVYRTVRLRDAGHAVAGAAVVAAVLDALENVGLLVMIHGEPSAWLAAGTAGLAWTKLALLATVIAYVAGALAVRGSGREPLSREDVGAAQGRVAGATRTVGLAPAPQDGGSGASSRLEARPELDEQRRREFEANRRRRTIGVSCSGGGIRSASFNLGALQQLGHEGVLKDVRYITAVSGGSYIAGALAVAGNAPALARPGAPPAFAPGTPEERHLRNNTHYLASSALVVAQGAARLLSGMAANVLFLGLLILVVSRPVGWLIASSPGLPRVTTRDGGVAVASGTWPALAVATALVVLAGVIQGLAPPTARGRGPLAWIRRGARQAGTATWVVAMVALLALVAVHLVLPWLVATVPGWVEAVPRLRRPDAESWALLQGTGLVAALLAAAAAFARRHFARIAMALGALLVPLLLLSGLLFSTHHAATTGMLGTWRAGAGDVGFRESLLLGPDWLVWAGALVVLLGVFVAGVRDINLLTMHRFYKRRLSHAYAIHRTADDRADPVPYERLLDLSQFPIAAPANALSSSGGSGSDGHGGDESGAGPELVVCAAANVNQAGVAPPGRNALSFTFSAREVGGPEVGYIPTADMEAVLESRSRRHLTLPAAIAISGAAVSPAMGKMTMRPISALLALTNVRLGVWLPNPRWLLAHLDPDDVGRRPRWSYFLRELVGRYQRDDPLLYVSDGGHWENLGLVELLRRGCTEIYCFDAGGDEAETMHGIGEAIALARTELGIDVHLDVEDLREPEDRQVGAAGDGAPATDGSASGRARRWGRRRPPLAPRDHIVGDFRGQGDGPDTEAVGRIVYVKAAVTRHAPWDVRAYRERHPRFPNHSTLLQLFDDERFEAYRALGADAARRAVATLRAVEPAPPEPAPPVPVPSEPELEEGRPRTPRRMERPDGERRGRPDGERVP